MSHTGETGRLFERRILGECIAVAAGEYLTRRNALEAARNGQPPVKTPTRARLERELRSLLDDTVRVRTAVGSVADYCHGVDGFIDFNGLVVTIDVTINPNKDAGKADMVVCEDDLIDLPALARRIAREFESRLNRAARSIIARRTQW
jgi:hypothetical protein